MSICLVIPHSMSCKHALLLRHNLLTLLHQTLSKNSLKEANYSEISPKKEKILPWKLRNLKACLK